MKILAIGDFHGKFPKKLQREIKKENPGLVLCTGDFYDSSVLRDFEFKHWQELKGAGMDYYELLRKVLGKNYRKLIFNFIGSGDSCVRKLDSLNIQTFVVHGNSDFDRYEKKNLGLNAPSLEENLKKSKNMRFIHNKKITDTFTIIGHGGYRGYLSKKEKMGVKKYSRELNRLFTKTKKPLIFVTHDAPYNCKLDLVKYKKSPLLGEHVGDEVYTSFAKKYSPMIWICGHMHENQGMQKISKTLVVNPGPAFEGKYAVITLENKKIRVKFKE